MTQKKIKSVILRGMESALWQRAKIAAIKREQTLATWVKAAIRSKLRKEEEQDGS
uniref:Uncharacterized protein n=1 Tax=viral metagenome TaxID=1070528 RepID=A0A6H2A426_9ZZZZ